MVSTRLLKYVKEQGTIEAGFLEMYYEKLAKSMAPEATKRMDEVHVTDLTSPCLRRSWFRKKFPYNVTLEGMIRMMIGRQVHAIRLLKEHELSVQWKGIHGSVDEYEDGFLLEKKTTRGTQYKSKRNRLPFTNHENQVNYYKVLLEKNKYPVVQAAVLYIDVSTAEVIVAPVKLRDSEAVEKEMTKRRDELVLAIESNRIPDRTFCWMCTGYCPYTYLCYSDQWEKWIE